jgi:hypothetical protein
VRKASAMPSKKNEVAPVEAQIYTVRGCTVLIDFDLATLYRVTTKVLLQSVRRNQNRFPEDFMFQLSDQEVSNLRSQIVTSSLVNSHGGRRRRPWVFTEQGVAMLSSVLRSEQAVRMNIEIMRAFVRFRRASLVSSKLTALIEDLAKRVDRHDSVINDIVDSIARLIGTGETTQSRPIGFTADITQGDG